MSPKPGEDLIKKKGDKTYNWCTHHNQWTLHKPEDCKLVSNSKAYTAEIVEDCPDDDDDDNSNTSTEENRATDTAMKSFAAACAMSE